MPFALITIGLLMIVVAIRGTHKEFGQLLVSDFTGSGNFVYWLVALGVVGALGYFEKLRPISRAFLVLILVAMFIRNGGFAQQFKAALDQGPQQINSSDPIANGQTPTIGGGGGTGDVLDIAKTALNFLPVFL